MHRGRVDVYATRGDVLDGHHARGVTGKHRTEAVRALAQHAKRPPADHGSSQRKRITVASPSFRFPAGRRYPEWGAGVNL
jgi:hypothetical protein